EASRARFDALVPQVIEIAAKFANPDATLERFLQLLEAISRRAAYLALLNEYPHAIENIAALANASSWAAEYLTRHPILLDELIDTRVLYAAPDWPQLKTALELQLRDAAGDTEREMDILRHFRHAQTFRLVAQDIAGLVPIETLADHLSDLADLVLGETIRLCWEGLRNRHRAEPAFAVIGYGKLGGKELGYASDLDIIFLYDDGAPEAQETYARLAQRINRWLTSLTPAGVLYETDLRLRPDGSGGMLVSPIEAFEDYQRGHAWVWEHQALTRGRFCAGDPRVGEKFERIRVAVLREQRDLDGLRREIIAMRRKMLDAHPNRSALFDIKHDRGGIVDVEFIVQFLVLGHSRSHPELTRNAGNLALLKLSGELGLIPRDLAQQVHAAYREFRQRQHRLRLNGEKYARVEPHKVRHHVAAVLKLWQTVLGEGDEVKGEG
ncbi:MAG: bifunctional [glutamate--ammonia ligase]-adenylyl-L-tyrosine phosphorylase/[glutamate--ammonia-ligase] adenylyltransferase, partial [Betaproteobacteria bacterium]|nr:bifunctional [glutamate--ammonia ligase]-adenylyl-L-tyrosine phosphorylase/[glutamate--ammonia-ligase] adenylyltransferase [Betaproteobacteria bacterium]